MDRAQIDAATKNIFGTDKEEYDYKFYCFEWHVQKYGGYQEKFNQNYPLKTRIYSTCL